MIREAGGVVTDLDGGDHWLSRGHVLAGSPGVHSGLRAAVRGRVDEAAMAALGRG